ncbi:unnamed protein product [Calicophoron daubneyi]|uniref:Uncharacterized protein n=1 Tax=Calicophoron daubneyi TaxID=300641 RepID=A0AAV2T6X0_CALDB
MFDKPLIDLIVPVSSSRPQTQGACPVSQKWFMLYYLLVERDLLNLRVTPISPNQPPERLKEMRISRQLPVVIYTPPGTSPPLVTRLSMLSSVSGQQRTESVAETEDERDQLLDSWHIPNFTSRSNNLPLVCQMVGSLNQLLQFGSVSSVQKCLSRINDHLKKTGTVFLEGDEPGYLDCILSPKLQHLRVAGGYYRGYSIPDELDYLQTYVNNICSLAAFRVSCPSDVDILLHYLERLVGTNTEVLAAHKRRIFQIPSDFQLLVPQEQKRRIEYGEQSPATCSGVAGTCPYPRSSLNRYKTMENWNRESKPDVSPDAQSHTTPYRGSSQYHPANSDNYSRQQVQDTRGHAQNPLYRNIPPSRYFNS